MNRKWDGASIGAGVAISATTDFLRNYTYNAIGNITNKSDQGNYLYEGNTGSRYENPNAVTNINSVDYSYDNNGNLLSNGTWNHTWDYNNRLVQSTSTSDTISYKYDHNGDRIKYSDGTVDTIFVNKLFDTTGATTTKHIYAGDMLIATIEDNGTAVTTNYVHTDHLGGSSVISNEDGDLIQTIDYYPFGEIRTNTKEGSFDESKKFTGHEHDDDTDLDYMVARYYDGGVGRFLSIDPAVISFDRDLLAKPQEQNSYSYVANNPLKHIDPTGEKLELVVRPLAGRLAGRLGVHSFLRITPENIGSIPNINGLNDKSSFTLGGYVSGNGVMGSLRKDVNNPSDSNMSNYGFNNSIEIIAPNGMSQVDFERSVVENYNNASNVVNEYSIVGNSKLTGQANCHNFSSQLLLDSGVDKSVIKSINTNGRLSPGLGSRAQDTTYLQQTKNYINQKWNSSKKSVSNFANKIKNKFKN